jgi:Ca-activated chloride channel homolog
MMVLTLWLLAAPAAQPAQPAQQNSMLERVATWLPSFLVPTRLEPHLADGQDALQNERNDEAVAAFRAAETELADERAVVEYDIAVAEKSTEGFTRAASLATLPWLKSEAFLAKANTVLQGEPPKEPEAAKQRLDDAVAATRDALRADPQNDRARRNLQRLLQQQQQQEQDKQDPKEGGEGEGKPEEEQPSESQENSKEAKENESKDKQENREKKEEQGKQKEESPQDEKPPSDPQKAVPAPGDPTDKAADSDEQLLEAIRSREKPLAPYQMRGQQRTRAKNGKDW